FKIAHRYSIPLQPFRLWFQPARKAAYIDKDIFPLHMQTLLREPVIDAFLEFHAPISVDDPRVDAERFRLWSMEEGFRSQKAPAIAGVVQQPDWVAPEVNWSPSVG